MVWVDVSPDDVENRWRPLTPAETAIADTIIGDAQDILELRLEESGVLAPPTEDVERWERTYVRTVAEMVKRVFINPEGVLEEQIDGYRWRRDRAVSSGLLQVPDGDVSQLLPRDRRRRRGAFSVVPG